ncbi:GldL-related protein [Hymenobacter fastidiosus]
MKAKYGLILFVLGFCLQLVGALFKIMHWVPGDTLLIISTTLMVAGMLLFAYKRLTHPKVKDFLNR